MMHFTPFGESDEEQDHERQNIQPAHIAARAATLP